MKEKKKKRSKSVATDPKSSSLVRPLILRHSSNPPTTNNATNHDLLSRLEAENEELKRDMAQVREDEAEMLAKLHRRLEEKDQEVSEMEEKLGRLKRRRAAEAEATENNADQLQLDLAQALAENKSLKLRLGTLGDVERARQSLVGELNRLKGVGRSERSTWEARLKQADRDAQSRIQRLEKEMTAEVSKKAALAQASALQKAQEETSNTLKENADLRSTIDALHLELSALRSANLHLRVKLESYSSIRVPKLNSTTPPEDEALELNNNKTQQDHSQSKTAQGILIKKMEEDGERERRESQKRMGNLSDEIERHERLSADQSKEIGRLVKANAGLEALVRAKTGRLEMLSAVAMGPQNGDRLPSLAHLAEALANPS